MIISIMSNHTGLCHIYTNTRARARISYERTHVHGYSFFKHYAHTQEILARMPTHVVPHFQWNSKSDLST